MKRPVMALTLGACLLAGCANTGTRDALDIQDPTVLQDGLEIEQSVAAGAVTAEWIATYSGADDRGRALDALAQRVGKLPTDEGSVYLAAKARCWTTAAREEQAARNQWGFVEEAMGEAGRLAGMAERGASSSARNLPLRTAPVLRPDLWQSLTQAQADPRAGRCPAAQSQIACAEVALAHAGHDAWTRDFDSASLRAGRVADALADITASLETCTPTVAPQVTETAAANISLDTDALFRFAEGEEAGLLPEGRDALDALIAEIRRPGIARSIEIVGYTDRLGSEGYNLRLSRQRAETVRAYLARKGVTVQLSARGAGPTRPVVACDSGDRAALIACLAPNRRVEITVRP